MTRLIALFALACVAAEPAVRSVDLRGLRVGGTTTLTVDGDDLSGARLLLPFAAKQVVKPGATARRAVFDVTLGADVSPGLYNLRVVGDGGVGAPLAVAVDALPQLRVTAKVESLPVALHGSVAGAATASASFNGRRGEKVIVEVEAQRLGSRLRPVVHLFDAKKKQIAWAWTKPALGGDARIVATLPGDGEYSVSLHDSEYAGQSPGHYRLKIGRWDYADAVFPPAVTAGGRSAELLGLGVRADLTPDGAAVWPKGGTWSGPRPFARVTGHPELIAVPGRMLEVPEGPAGVSGKLAPDAEERFRLAVRPGGRVRLEVFAERIGSPLHASVIVRDEKGAQLARADEGPTSLDPVLEYAVPATVKSVMVAIADTNGDGGVYRLAVAPAGAEAGDFRLFTRSGRATLPDAGRCVVPVLLDRRGYQGEITLSAEGLPAGVKLEGATIPAGAEGALVTVQRGGAFEAALTRWVGRGGKRDVPVLVSGDPLESVQPWAAAEIPVAASTAKASELVIDWRTPAPDGIVPARKMTLPVKVTRPGGANVVRLTLLTSQNVPLVNNQPDPNRSIRAERPTELAAKVDAGDVPVLVPADLPATSHDLAVMAEMLAADRRTVLATAYTPVKRLPVKTQLLVSADAPRVAVKADAKKPVPVEIKGKLERREGLTGDVALTLTGLPPGVAAANVTVPVGRADFVFKLSLPAGYAAGEYSGIKLGGSAVADPKVPAVRVRSRDVEITLVVQ